MIINQYPMAAVLRRYSPFLLEVLQLTLTLVVISSGVLHLAMEAQHLVFRFCLTKQLRLLFMN